MKSRHAKYNFEPSGTHALPPYPLLNQGLAGPPPWGFLPGQANQLADLIGRVATAPLSDPGPTQQEGGPAAGNPLVSLPPSPASLLRFCVSPFSEI